MEKIEINKKLYESLINENIRLRIALANYIQQGIVPKSEPMERQISIEEYTKTLKPKQTKEEK